jgi:spermidine synthase
LAVLRAKSPIKQSAGQIYEHESAYNYIQVLEQDGYRYLRLNEGQGIHSIWHPTELNYGGPWQQFLAAPFFNAPPYDPKSVHSMAIVGLAAGTTARQATAAFGPIQIDGYEIDPDIIEVGRQYFGMDLPNLNPIAEDGRVGLARSEQKYDIIGVDAYRPPYIPWHLTTQDFFQMARDHLTEHGALVINVGRSPTDRKLVNDLASTLQTVFPSVYVMDVPYSYNTIIYATLQPTQPANLFANLDQLAQRSDTHPLLLSSLSEAARYLQPTPPLDVVYTDDWAPIEWITNNMVLNFVLFGDMEDLQ